jgi:diguanylate cyclase (GGDEF)-like protein
MPTASQRRAAHSTTLARRLVGAVFVWYILFSLGITLAQLGWKAVTIKRDIAVQLAALSESFRPGMAKAVWNYDDALAEAILAGIAQYPIVTGACVTDLGGQVVFGQPSAAAAFLSASQRVVLEAAKADGVPQRLGHLEIHSGPGVIYGQLRKDLATILVNALLTALALWLVFKAVVERALSRPLSALTATVATIEENTRRGQPTAFRYAWRDELGVLVDALNDANRRWLASHLELESTVEARTRELKAANAKLEALSMQDGLTGLANRRCFDQALEHEWRRAGREATSVALILIDVDHFKKFNDRYGHQAGDACLRQVAGVLAAQAQRAGELAARYGGEEFAVVLPAGGDAGDALELAERIREKIAALAIPHQANDSGVVTVSLGVAALAPRTGDVSATLVEQADKALYQAKQGGRDRTVAFGAA